MKDAETGSPGVYTRMLDRVHQDVERLLTGRGHRELNLRIAPRPHSAAWLVWHVLRGQDRNISEMSDQDQLWTRGNWAAEWDRSPDPHDTGLGHSDREVADFTIPSTSDPSAYAREVRGLTSEFLGNLVPEDLSTPHWSPTLENRRSVAERLEALIYEGHAHLGQAFLIIGAR